jgi:hypothetical protein
MLFQSLKGQAEAPRAALAPSVDKETSRRSRRLRNDSRPRASQFRTLSSGLSGCRATSSCVRPSR